MKIKCKRKNENNVEKIKKNRRFGGIGTLCVLICFAVESNQADQEIKITKWFA